MTRRWPSEPMISLIMATSSSASGHPLITALAGLAFSLGLLVCVVGGYFTFTGLQVAAPITVLDADVAGSPDIAGNWLEVLQASQSTPTEPLNILLLGSDTRQGQGSGFGSVEAIAGARSDTAIFLHLAADRKRAVALSIPRDLLVSIPSCTGSDGQPTQPTYDRFNAAFDLGGPACTVATVKELLGLPVNHIMVIDFRGFQKVIDSLGGLEVCLTQPIDDVKAKVSLPAGKQTLSGEEALGLARARYTVADGSDLSRIVRQQALLRAAIRQVQDSGLAYNPNLLRETLTTVTAALSTDKQLASLEALASLALQVRGLPLGNIEFTTVPWVHTGDGQTVQPDQERLDQVIEALRASILPLKPEKAKGTGQGSPSSETKRAPSTCADPVF